MARPKASRARLLEGHAFGARPLELGEVRVAGEQQRAVEDVECGLPLRDRGEYRSEERSPVDVDRRSTDLVPDRVHASSMALADGIVVLGGIRVGVEVVGVDGGERRAYHLVPSSHSLVMEAEGKLFVVLPKDLLAALVLQRRTDAYRPPS